MGLPPHQLVEVDGSNIGVLVGRRLLGDGGEARCLLVVPGHEQGPGALDGDARRLGVGPEEVEAACDQTGFERPRRGVEPGVEDGGVGLARAGSDVGGGVEQHDRCARQGCRPGDRRAHHPGPDHGHVLGAHRDRVASAASRQRTRRASASSGVTAGSYTASGVQAGVGAPPSWATPRAVAWGDG